ncbi:MAG: hypothetical protein OXC55_01120 [Chloroflexi bacterium]|nr:hypothetical protein [Chloroflexota bacterium]
MFFHATRFGALLAMVAIATTVFAPAATAETPDVSDNRPVVSFTAPDAITEGEPALFTFTRVGDLSSDLALNLEFYLEGQFLQDDEIGEVWFTAGEAVAVLSIPTNDDDIAEPDGYIGVLLQSRYFLSNVQEPYHIGPPAYREVAVRDNDRPAVATVSSASPPV